MQEQSIEERARRAKDLFESAVDRQARADTAGSLAIRFPLGFIKALARILVLPIWLPKLWCSERKFERLKNQSEAEPVRGIDDPQPTPVSMTSFPICVAPLATFEALGAKLGETKPAGLFVLLAPVLYDANKIRPVGTTKDPDFKTILQVPKLDGIQQVPNSFITDFASIPPLLRLFGRPVDRYARAAVVHDWAYAFHPDGTSRGREDCDRAMLVLMRGDGVSSLRRALIFAGLRIGGGMAYRSAPHRRQQLRPCDEAICMPFMGVQTYLLTYLTRQMEEADLLDTLQVRAKRTEASSQLWSVDIGLSIHEAQIRHFGRPLF